MFKRIGIIALTVALTLTNMNIPAYAEKAISDGDNYALVSVSDTTVDNAKWNELVISKDLPDLNDGIITMLNSDTKLVDDNGTEQNDTVLIKNTFFENKYTLSAKHIITNDVIISKDDIELCADNISAYGTTVIYSLNGDIILNASNMDFEGIIYAPNGTVKINADKFLINGKIITRKFDGKCGSIRYKDNDVIKKLQNKIERTKYNLVRSENELYGEYYSNLDYKAVGKKAIVKNHGGSVDDTDITLGDVIPLLDSRDKISYYGINYCIEMSGEKGFIVIGAHTKTQLIEEINSRDTLPLNKNIYYFPGGEIYYKSADMYKTLNGTIVPVDKFEEYKQERSLYYVNIQRDYLEDLENANKELLHLDSRDIDSVDEFMLGAAHYNGTDSNAYGYGGISNISAYMKSRYGGTPKVKDTGKSLVINTATMQSISGKNANNCSLVAISKVLKYYQSQKNKTKINSNIKEIYKRVEKIGTDKYGYDDKSGTGATKINNIMIDSFKYYGYSATCNGVYVWNFNDQVKNEINAGRPVVMNIARGYYGNHSVTVGGYSIYETNSTDYQFIKVVDGWIDGYRYIDYKAFAYDLASSGFGSFNTAEVN